MSKEIVRCLIVAVRERHICGIFRLISEHQMGWRKPCSVMQGSIVGKRKCWDQRFPFQGIFSHGR